MGQNGEGGGARYRAFISYSHKDQALAKRLHRRLEAYRLPSRLAAPGGKRLSPIFRDRDELPAAGDLTAEVRAALQASAALIVVCSPSAAASQWVAREIEVFRELHPDRPILPALVRGEPAEAFPATLGQTTREPLAADFRPGRDGSRLALLKLVAGALGLGLDKLVQRDSQRRLRRVTAVTVAACALVLALTASTIVALQARAEAERQRAEAEGLVEFMLTDLRTRLRGVGRLDVMSAVNAQALDYYHDQDLGRLPAASLERRALLLQEMGEDDQLKGDFDRASREFDEAERTTATLLQEKPDDPERIFDHAQSEFWIGSIAASRKRPQDARRGYEAYLGLADRLVAINPNDGRYQREAGYAEGDLCDLDLHAERAAPALAECRAALAHMQAAARRLPPGSGIDRDLINRHAWLADADQNAGDLDGARQERLEEERELAPLIAADPKNLDLAEDWVVLQRALGRLDARQGRPGQARARLLEARTKVDAMTVFDPANKRWRGLRAKLDGDIAALRNTKIGESKQ